MFNSAKKSKHRSDFPDLNLSGWPHHQLALTDPCHFYNRAVELSLNAGDITWRPVEWIADGHATSLVADCQFFFVGGVPGEALRVVSRGCKNPCLHFEFILNIEWYESIIPHDGQCVSIRWEGCLGGELNEKNILAIVDKENQLGQNLKKFNIQTKNINL